jgi:hypothetical protein
MICKILRKGTTKKWNMQEKWGFFKKNRPLYAGIGIFRQILGGIADLGKGGIASSSSRNDAREMHREKPE